MQVIVDRPRSKQRILDESTPRRGGTHTSTGLLHGDRVAVLMAETTDDRDGTVRVSLTREELVAALEVLDGGGQ